MASAQTVEAESKRVLVVKDGPLGWLRIDNAARMNAMSFAMWGDLLRGVETLGADGEIRVIVVTGHDGRAFCAGGDISEFDTLRVGADSRNSYDVAGKAAMAALRSVEKPTIALIEGYCLGGGMGLALQCDLRFATESARLGIPAAKRGIAYNFDGIKQLVGLVGPANAKDILFSARQFSGHEALAMGLVNRVLPDGGIRAAVQEAALVIAVNAPMSIRASKMMIEAATHNPEDRDLPRYVAAEIACLNSEDYQEATRSFMEKRPPVFTGR